MDNDKLLLRILDKLDAMERAMSQIGEKLAVHDSVHAAFERQRRRVGGARIALISAGATLVLAVATILPVVLH